MISTDNRARDICLCAGARSQFPAPQLPAPGLVGRQDPPVHEHEPQQLLVVVQGMYAFLHGPLGGGVGGAVGTGGGGVGGGVGGAGVGGGVGA